MLETAGAPFEQGHAQGSVCAGSIARATARLRRQYGFGIWQLTLSEVHLGAGRLMRRHTPQLHERLEGIAAGAGVKVSALELFDAQARIFGVGTAGKDSLEARLEIPDELAPLLLLRHSRPDAGGFDSVELTGTAWAGCLAGINSAGLGAIVIEDRAPDVPSLRVLAQDLIFRRDELASGLDHLRHCASYTSATGVLHLVAPGLDALRVELQEGRLEVSRLPAAGAPVAESTVRLDAAARSLEWSASAGGLQSVKCPAAAPSLGSGS